MKREDGSNERLCETASGRAAELSECPSLAIFIPAYQAERTLARVVESIPQELYDRLRYILIQDDSSTDGTGELAQRIQLRNPKVVLSRNRRNLGYGGTNKQAFRRLRTMGVDAYVMIHGDCQHDPRYALSLLEPIVAGVADIVIGSRMLGGAWAGGMPLDRWIANKALSLALNWVLGLRIRDYHSGFVAFRIQALDTIHVESCGDGHELTAEILVRAAQKGLRMTEVAVPTRYDSRSRSCSRIVGAGYAINVLKLTFRVGLENASRRVPRVVWSPAASSRRQTPSPTRASIAPQREGP